MSKRLTAATLFSGIGAPEVAYPEWDWLWHAEVDPFPSAVMAARHPTSINLGDVTAHDFCDHALAIGRPDVLVFGSPCQSYSVAGKRLGLDDPRGNLALHALRIVSALRPRWFVFENVPGLYSSWSGGPASHAGWEDRSGDRIDWDREYEESSDFASFLQSVDDIGYSSVWTTLDAQYFGVAQRRKRVFVVGHLGPEWQRAAAVLLEPESLSGHPPSRGAARQDTPYPVTPSLTGSGRGVERAGESRGQDPLVVAFGGNNTSGPIAAAAGINAGGQKRIDFESETLLAVFDPTQVTSPTNRSRVHPELSRTLPRDGYAPVAYGFNHQSGGDMRGVDLRDTVQLQQQQQSAVAVSLGGREGGATAELGGEQSTALRASQGGGDKPHVLQPMGVRRLMPVECERLQGLPDHYTAVTYRKKPAMDGPRYKALGNSMAVPVVRWILSRIAFVDTL